MVMPAGSESALRITPQIDLRVLATLEAGRFDDEMERVDLTPLLVDLVDEYRDLATAKKQSLELDAPDSVTICTKMSSRVGLCSSMREAGTAETISATSASLLTERCAAIAAISGRETPAATSRGSICSKEAMVKARSARYGGRKWMVTP